MRYFTAIQTVTLGEDLVAKARNFARQVTPSVGTPGRGYRDSGQPNLQKIERDHFAGKVGEEAVRIVFERLHRAVRGPDYQIYEGKQKSWDSDLWIDGIGLAVKTQTTALSQKYGLSWTFQAGAVRTDPILLQPDAWVCFVEVDVTDDRCLVYPPYQIRDLVFAEPQLDRLKGDKKVVYAAQLPLSSPLSS